MSCESVAPTHAKTIDTNFALKSFHAIINLVSERWNTIEFPLRILYFTPNFTNMLLNADVLRLLGFFFFFLGGKKSVYRDLNSRPNVSEGYEVTSELPGRPYNRGFVFAVLVARMV